MSKVFMVLFLTLLPQMSFAGIFGSSPEEIKKERSLIKEGQTLNKHKAIVVAQACLLDSKYSKDYDFRSYQINYDKGIPPNTGLWFEKFGHPAWFIGFVSKNNNDQCMYGAIVFQDGKDNACGCLRGI